MRKQVGSGGSARSRKPQSVVAWALVRTRPPAKSRLRGRRLLQENRPHPVADDRVLVDDVTSLDVTVVAKRKGEEAANPILNRAKTIGPGIREPTPNADRRDIGISELPTKTSPQGGDERRRAVSDLGKDLNDFIRKESPDLILQATVLEGGITRLDLASIEQRVIRIHALEPSRGPITAGMPIPPDTQPGLGNEARSIGERLTIQEIAAGDRGGRARRRRRGSRNGRDARSVLVTNAAEVLVSRVNHSCRFIVD